jgi:hypothetical protein
MKHMTTTGTTRRDASSKRLAAEIRDDVQEILNAEHGRAAGMVRALEDLLTYQLAQAHRRGGHRWLHIAGREPAEPAGSLAEVIPLRARRL